MRNQECNTEKKSSGIEQYKETTKGTILRGTTMERTNNLRNEARKEQHEEKKGKNKRNEARKEQYEETTEREERTRGKNNTRKQQKGRNEKGFLSHFWRFSFFRLKEIIYPNSILSSSGKKKVGKL